MTPFAGFLAAQALSLPLGWHSALPGAIASPAALAEAPASTATPPATPVAPDAPNEPASPTAPKPATPPAKAARPPTVPTADNIVEAKPRTDLPRQRVVILGESFDAELCLEDATRSLGMGGRDAFPEGNAMIFVHPRPRMLGYWMKDCLIDMDMIFIDASGKIASFHEATREPLRSRTESVAAYEARLPRYGPSRAAQFVIELPAGSIQRLKPSVGQQIAIDWRALVARAR